MTPLAEHNRTLRLRRARLYLELEQAAGVRHSLTLKHIAGRIAKVPRFRR